MDDPRTIRLLECWLPLAQELNEAQGWGDGAADLEALIRQAANALAAAESADTARAILLVYHVHLRRGLR